MTTTRPSNNALRQGMKELTSQQIEAVKAWTEQGVTLAEIQKRLSDEFGVTMTYMDVRFLIEDLNLELRDKAASSQPELVDEASEGAETQQVAQDDEPELLGGNVSVELDRIARPGAVVSGSVTFSDGQSAQWYLDQLGRLGLDPSDSEYRPSQEDIQSFQQELQAVLQRQGF